MPRVRCVSVHGSMSRESGGVVCGGAVNLTLDGLIVLAHGPVLDLLENEVLNLIMMPPVVPCAAPPPRSCAVCCIPKQEYSIHG